MSCQISYGIGFDNSLCWTDPSCLLRVMQDSCKTANYDFASSNKGSYKMLSVRPSSKISLEFMGSQWSTL